MSYQQILIQGNLTRDAEVRQVGQSQVAKVSVAVSEKFKDRSGQVQESVEYFDVEIWDKAPVYPFLTKGQSVLIVGSQKTDRWQDQQGNNRENKKVRAAVVQLCGIRPQTQQQQAPQYQQQAPAPMYAPQPPVQQQSYPQAPPMPPQAPSSHLPMPPQQPQTPNNPDDLPF